MNLKNTESEQEITMPLAEVKTYFATQGLEDRIKEFDASSATVELAAKAVGCEPARIAKTLSFLLGDDRPVLIVLAGDARINNKKYKETFGQKAKMIPAGQVEMRIGHKPGGVCPFVIKPEVKVYLDVSLKRFDIIYPAAGSANSAVALSLAELEKHAGAVGWVDIG